MKANTIFAWAALVCASLAVFWSNMRQGSYFRLMMRHDPRSAAVALSRQITDLDENARKLAPPAGNLAIAFRGYSPTNAEDANFAARVFFRFNYALYPQRVEPIIPAQAVVNTGDDLLTSLPLPETDWLREHEIGSIAVFSKLPSGETFVRPIPVPAP